MRSRGWQESASTTAGIIPLVPGVRACAKNRQWVVFLKANTCLSILNEITGLFIFFVQYVLL